MFATTQSGHAQTARSPIRTLLLDDDPFDRKRITRITERSDRDISVQEVQSITDMAKIIDDEPFDLILLDYNLAEGDGMDALTMIQNGTKNKDTAVIMISGSQQSAVAVQAFRNGCRDFLNKDDLNSDTLMRSMNTALSASPRQNLPVMLDTELLQIAVENAVSAALHAPNIQDALRDGIETAAKALAARMPDYTSDATLPFVEAFLKEDEFVFKT